MKEFALTAKDKLKRIDPILLFCTLAMNLMSVITLAASSDAYGTWYVKAQILASVIGISAMIIISFIDYDALICRVDIPPCVRYFLRRRKHGKP